ncbi:hypothetical protein NCAS_0B08840 [Naumovozyma castellii]|uniref:Ras-associating domain-containing protein n=1 Tax=Naumovozyma castellii TaxID=27288 RepID=G0VAU1_NAUCA|nr:hypothetical protein NCAS_0B08840 [Naumovozyma castellii CBS 4309]CCC68968.1 hypothetical protein NCAS_0B08840 [Naumovozyma castellii CBS 4309]
MSNVSSRISGISLIEQYNESQLMSETDSTSSTPLKQENYEHWSVQEVVTWCSMELSLAESDSLCQQLKINSISGDVLSELTMNDCKELCSNDLKRAIKLKIALNKLISDQDSNKADFSKKSTDDSQLFEERQEKSLIILKDLYSTVSQKLQEFQIQYSALRTDILEMVKTVNSTDSSTLLAQQQQQQIFPQTLTHRPSTASVSSQSPSMSAGDSAATSPTYSVSTVQRSNSNRYISKPEMVRSVSTSSSVNNMMGSVVSTPGTTAEPLKQLRASKEDSCERILKNAMKRHNLNDKDWKQYVLVICYGDQERILELNEKPVLIFKNLKQQGLHPAIMLRRRGDFEELSLGNVNDNDNGDGTFIPSHNESLNRPNDDVTPGGRL